MADGEEIPKHALQISRVEVEPFVSTMFEIWRPALLLTPVAPYPIRPWVLIPEDDNLIEMASAIRAAASKARADAAKARRAFLGRKP